MAESTSFIKRAIETGNYLEFRDRLELFAQQFESSQLSGPGMVESYLYNSAGYAAVGHGGGGLR